MGNCSLGTVYMYCASLSRQRTFGYCMGDYTGNQLRTAESEDNTQTSLTNLNFTAAIHSEVAFRNW